MGKEKSYDELTQELEAKKAELKTKRSELETFEKENGLKRGKDHSEDAKHGKAWKKLKASIDKLVEDRNSLAEAQKAAKPKKEKVERASKYEYPADCVSAADRKKYRASQRAKTKKADKPEKPAKAEKAKPAKAEKEEAKAVDKTAKKKDKDKKKKAVVED